MEIEMDSQCSSVRRYWLNAAYVEPNHLSQVSNFRNLLAQNRPLHTWIPLSGI